MQHRLQTEQAVSVFKKSVTILGKNGVEQDIGGTSGASQDAESDKRESRNKDSAQGIPDSAEAPRWKITSTTIPQN